MPGEFPAPRLVPSLARVHLQAMIAPLLQPFRPAKACVPALFTLLGLTLAGCAGAPETAQQRAAYEACRSQAEQQFTIQNRASLYQPDTSLTPHEGPIPALAETTALADQYTHRQMVQACLRGATGPAPAAPANTRN